MPLTDVLQSLKAIILEDLPLPESEVARKEYLKERFTSLSKEEVEDLAAIEPEKIKTYTSTIFTGEASIIRHHYKITISLLEKYWPSVHEVDFSLARFARRLQQTHPWKGHATQDYVQSVYECLTDGFESVHAKCPALGTIALLENRNVQIKRSAASSVVSGVSLEELSTLAVTDFLALTVELNATAVLERFDYDVVSLYRQTYAGAAFDTSTLVNTAQVTFAMGFRNNKNVVIWLPLSEDVFDFFRANKAFSTQTFAEAVYESMAGEDEAQKFTSFSQLIASLVQTQALSLQATN